MTFREDLEELLRGPFAGIGGQKALADTLHVAPETVSRWLAGRNEPHVTNRAEVARMAAKERRRRARERAVASS
jgi:DNA-binding transcriptional regulator YdaS (Cro superfamily)